MPNASPGCSGAEGNGDEELGQRSAECQQNHTRDPGRPTPDFGEAKRASDSHFGANQQAKQAEEQVQKVHWVA